MKIRTLKSRTFSSLAATASAALLLSACGAVSTANPTTQSGSNSSDLSNVVSYGSSSSSGTSTTTTTTGTQAPWVYPIQGSGYTSLSVSVSTGQTLKVRFRPSVQSTAVYPHLAVFITVGSSTQDTGMLRTGADGLGAADVSDALDFSSAIPLSCTASGCRQTVTIQISKPNYDYWCATVGMYCPWNHVSQGHPWGGSLIVQTDDTQAI